MMLSSKKSFLMKPFSLLIAVLVLGVTLFAADAEAKRLGGSRSFGMQRSTAINRSPSTQTHPCKKHRQRLLPPTPPRLALQPHPSARGWDPWPA